MPEDQMAFLQAGAAAVLTKPCAATDIQMAIAKHGLCFDRRMGVAAPPNLAAATGAGAGTSLPLKAAKHSGAKD